MTPKPTTPAAAPDAHQVRFDRPFILAVRDVKTGLLLIVAQVHEVR